MRDLTEITFQMIIQKSLVNRFGVKKTLVPGAGIEPAHSQGARDFKSLASTNSAIPATGVYFMLCVL
jgi:hypothetical protein